MNTLAICIVLRGLLDGTVKFREQNSMVFYLAYFIFQTRASAISNRQTNPHLPNPTRSFESINNKPLTNFC